MNTCIRAASSNDIEQIAPLLIELDKLHAKKYPTVFDETKISNEKRIAFLLNNINQPNNLFIIAETASLIIGVVHCYIQETKDHPIKIDKKVAILSDIYVDIKHRKMGIASRLINSSLESIKQIWKIDSVCLNVFYENQDAIKLYERLGFQQQYSRYSISV